jgi:hypothetical protein
MSEDDFDGVDLLDEMESQEEDEKILEELSEKKKERNKTFKSIINKKKVSEYELDEVML